MKINKATSKINSFAEIEMINTDVCTKNSNGDPVQYKLISIPFYLLGQIHRLLNLIIK